MPTRLQDNINSKYFEAANALKSKNARRRIVAYVESYDDISSGARCSLPSRTTSATSR